MNVSMVTNDALTFGSQKQRSIDLLNRLRNLMKGPLKPTFEFLVEDEPLILRIKYLGRRFDIRCEVPHTSKGDLSKMQIATYVDLEERLTDFVFVFAFAVDKDSIEAGRYTENTFADAYLERFVEEVKAKLVSLKKPLIIQ